jgi:hypothetical protein
MTNETLPATREPEAAAQEMERAEPTSQATEAELFKGLAQEPVSEEAKKTLLAVVSDDDVEIRPDGLIYLPEIKYRRVLNEAFGPGGWGLRPMSKPTVQGDIIMREFAMYVNGRFASCAVGEARYFGENSDMSYATAHESAKSNAMMRCCKDLGIASHLWDPQFIAQWKDMHAVGVWCENIGKGRNKGQKKLLWRRKRGKPIGYPWQEQGAPQEGEPPAETPPATPRRGERTAGRPRVPLEPVTANDPPETADLKEINIDDEFPVQQTPEAAVEQMKAIAKALRIDEFEFLVKCSSFIGQDGSEVSAKSYDALARSVKWCRRAYHEARNEYRRLKVSRQAARDLGLEDDEHQDDVDTESPPF